MEVDRGNPNRVRPKQSQMRLTGENWVSALLAGHPTTRSGDCRVDQFVDSSTCQKRLEAALALYTKVIVVTIKTRTTVLRSVGSGVSDCANRG